jgi:hypothetical protein
MRDGSDEDSGATWKGRLRDHPLVKYVTAPQPPERVREAERLTAAFAERIAEVLPPGEFELKVTGFAISVIGIGVWYGNSYGFALHLTWYLPHPASRRLEMVFEGQMDGLQEFLSNMRRAPWPSKGALPHVRVIPSTVYAWWGGPTCADAVVSLRPLDRAELGV